MKSMNNGEGIAESNGQMKWEDKQPDLRALIYKLRLMIARDENVYEHTGTYNHLSVYFGSRGRAGRTHTS